MLSTVLSAEHGVLYCVNQAVDGMTTGPTAGLYGGTNLEWSAVTPQPVRSLLQPKYTLARLALDGMRHFRSLVLTLQKTSP